MKHPIRLFILVLFSFAVSPSASYAMQDPPGVKALLDAMARQSPGSDRPVYEEIEPDGNGGATLRRVSWKVRQPDAEMDIKIEKIVISGVSQRPNGQYFFKSILSENIVLTAELPNAGPVVISIPSVPTTNTYILPQSGANGTDYSAFLGTAVYEASFIPIMKISVAGKTFEAKNLSVNWKGDPDTGFGKWDISMGNISIPVAAFPNPNFRKDMKEEFGIETFNVGLDASVEISGQNNNLDIAYGFRLTEEQVGDFEFAVAALDVPGKLFAILNQVQAGRKPNMAQIMPLVIGVKFAKLKMRFVDNNFTKTMLAYAAKKQGTNVEAMTSNGAALIQVGLMQLNLPEFSKTVVDAYNAFVKNPQNISIQASPESPVALATLMGLMAAPAAAIKTLGVKVEANR